MTGGGGWGGFSQDLEEKQHVTELIPVHNQQHFVLHQRLVETHRCAVFHERLLCSRQPFSEWLTTALSRTSSHLHMG